MAQTPQTASPTQSVPGAAPIIQTSSPTASVPDSAPNLPMAPVDRPNTALYDVVQQTAGGPVETLSQYADRTGQIPSPAVAKLYNQGLGKLKIALDTQTADQHQPPAYIGQSATDAAASSLPPTALGGGALPMASKAIQPINVPGPEPVVTSAPPAAGGNVGDWLKGLVNGATPIIQGLGKIAQAYTAGAAAGAAGKPEEGYGLTIAGRQQSQANTQAQIDNNRLGIENNFRLQMLALNQNKDISAAERALRQQEITNDYNIRKQANDIAARQAGMSIAGKRSDIYDTFGSVK